MKTYGFCLLLVSACVGAASAQEGGVASSGLDQGEASINVRSDVKLGIKGTGGTTSERLAKLGEAVSEQMADIRGCYRKQVASSAEVVGGLRVELSLPPGGPPNVVVTAQQGGSNELTLCVSRLLQKASWKTVGRPAAAVLSLEFDNTRARGQTLMNARVAETAHIDVHAGQDGQQEATWSTDGKEVTFTVRAQAAVARESVELVVHGFHEGYAGFLDCRRHSEKGGVSPEGDISAEVSIDRQGKGTAKLGAITVHSDRAPKCAEKAFKHLSFDKPPSPVHASVLVHFAP